MKPNKRSISTGIVAIIIFSFAGYTIHTNHSSHHIDSSASNVKPTMDTTSKKNDSAIKQSEAKNAAENTVYTILSNTAFKYDSVDREYVFYGDINKSSLVPYDHLTWKLFIESDGKVVGPYIRFVTHQNLDLSTNWIFWDQLTFSSSVGKYDYTMPDVIAGQAYGGKGTQLDDSGTYEYALIPLRLIQNGISILTTGNSPVIRYRGNQYYYDYHVTQEEIEQLKIAIELAKNLTIINNKVDIQKLPSS